jgi:diacylglycerol kinase (ATP)
MKEKTGPVGIILNPAAGRGKAASFGRQLEEIALESKVPFLWRESEAPAHATSLAKQMMEDGYKTIIGCGGDGTINEIGSALAGHPEVKFGIVPLGMGNDFIRSAGIPRDPDKALRMILSGNHRVIHSDCGRINGHHFFNNLGIGFDGAVVLTAQKVNHMKNPYYAGVARHLLTYRTFAAHLRSDGKARMSEPIFMFVASIGKAYGGGFYITPDARLDDGLMDVVVVPGTNHFSRPWLLYLVSRRKHLKHKGFRFFRSRNVELDLYDKVLNAHVDGIHITVTGKVKVELIPGALSVISEKEGGK